MEVEKLSKKEIIRRWGIANEEVLELKEEISKNDRYIELLTCEINDSREKLRQIEKQEEKAKEEERKSTIIKNGTRITLDSRTYVTKCRICGCVFTYKKEDVCHNSAYALSYVFCPECDCLKFLFIKRKYKGGKE